jgi:hypothetical protein
MARGCPPEKQYGYTPPQGCAGVYRARPPVRAHAHAGRRRDRVAAGDRPHSLIGITTRESVQGSAVDCHNYVSMHRAAL